MRVPYGYQFLGAFNTKQEAIRAIGKSAYKLHKVKHGGRTVYYAYVLR